MNQRKMFTKIKKIGGLLSLGIVLGFTAGTLYFLLDIIPQYYLSYKMYGIILLTLTSYLNATVVIFTSGVLVGYGFYVLLVKKKGVNKARFMRVCTAVGVIGLVYIVIDKLVIAYMPSPSLISAFIFLKKALSERGAMFYTFLASLQKQPLVVMLAIASLSLCIGGIVIMFWLLAKINWDTFLKMLDVTLINSRHSKKLSLLFVLFLVALNISTFVETKINVSQRPPIILITVETTRADHCGCYGYNRDTSNTLDAFAAQSVFFETAISQAPCTFPSIWNIITSKYQCDVPASIHYVTIAEYLRDKGYTTGAFISHFLPYLLFAEKGNLAQGFSVYQTREAEGAGGKAKSITDAAIAWIQANKHKPFFIWLFYFDPHDPYAPPDAFKGYYTKDEKFNRDREAQGIDEACKKKLSGEHKTFLINAYDEELRYLDYELGKLFAYLKEVNAFDNSLIIITSDHGEELGDNGNRWDHCQLLSREEIWVPLLIKMPEQKEKIKIKEPVQTIDIYPTLLEYFGDHNSPTFASLEGKSLMPLIEKRHVDEPRYALSVWRGQKCMVKGKYKYGIGQEGERLTEFKSKEIIPNEALRNKLRDELENLCNEYCREDKPSYRKTIKRLKSIGYIQ